MKWLALKVLRLYKRYISPVLPSACRFTPTCSEYMYEAIQIHGVGRGTVLGLKRLWRCQPMYPGGYDPVPPREGGPTQEPERLQDAISPNTKNSQ